MCVGILLHNCNIGQLAYVLCYTPSVNTSGFKTFLVLKTSSYWTFNCYSVLTFTDSNSVH